MLTPAAKGPFDPCGALPEIFEGPVGVMVYPDAAHGILHHEDGYADELAGRDAELQKQAPVIKQGRAYDALVT